MIIKIIIIITVIINRLIDNLKRGTIEPKIFAWLKWIDAQTECHDNFNQMT